MTREKLRKHWEMIEAFKNGETLERRYAGARDWEYVDNPQFHLESDYRIKPKTFNCGVLGELSNDELKILWHRVNCAGSDFDDAYVKASLDDFPNLGKIENRPMKCRDLFIKIENVLSK